MDAEIKFKIEQKIFWSQNLNDSWLMMFNSFTHQQINQMKDVYILKVHNIISKFIHNFSFFEQYMIENCFILVDS